MGFSQKEARARHKVDVLHNLAMGVLLMEKYRDKPSVYEGVSLFVKNPTTRNSRDSRHIYLDTHSRMFYVTRRDSVHIVSRKSLDGYILKNKLFDIYVQLPYSRLRRIGGVMLKINASNIKNIEDRIEVTIDKMKTSRP
jgi:hypothetical protein